MSYKILSLKWRPSEFSEIIGQDHISHALSNAIKLNRVAQAFIFSGPRGVGKTTAARVLAKKLNKVSSLNDSIDIIEMDAASNRGIDEIRHLRENVQYAPSEGKYKIYIIDEAHMLTKEAFNALLKTLEEPPPHVIFIFATTELYKMPETIISRTQRYDFKRLSTDDISKRMEFILKEEEISFDQDSLAKIADKADGSMRDALSILDQMICICNNDIKIDQVTSSLGIVNEENFLKILLLVSTRNTKDLLNSFNKIISSGISIFNFIEGFNKFINKCLISKAMQSDQKYKDFYKIYKTYNIELSELDLLRISEICLKFQSSFRNLQQPRISLESLLVKLSYIDKAVDINKYIKIKNSIKTEKPDEKNKGNSSSDDRLNKNNQIINKNIKIDSLDDSSKSNAIISDNKENSKDNLELNEEKDGLLEVNKVNEDSIYNNWDNILSSIDKANIVHSLEKIKIKELTESKIVIMILDINEFMYKNLLKEIALISQCINKYFNINLKLEILYSENKKKMNNDKKKKESLDKEHPLFMDAMNKFEGEIIR